MTASAHILQNNSVTRVMLLVLACLLPGVLAYAWQFGWGIVINLAWASLLALALEAIALRLRGYPAKPFLTDGSSIVTAWLLALSLPPLAPWWLTLEGMVFAIGVAKHLYGGLGQNIFNPAMVGFAVLIISFPVQMTQWSAPVSLAMHPLGFSESLALIFSGSLPPGVDSKIMDGYLARALERAPDDLPVLFLPVQRIGVSVEHEAYPGTLLESR